MGYAATLPKIHADGVAWPLDTFIDAYRFDRVDASKAGFPDQFTFRLVLTDGSLIGPILGHEVRAFRPSEVLAVQYVAGGGDDVVWGQCGSCHGHHPLQKNTCAACHVTALEDAWLEDDCDCCPHCGGRL